jgi:polyhydroxyalkanoate synthesis regulator protein
MTTQNPFSIVFGVEPENTIERLEEKQRIIGDFSMPNPPTNVYIITGLRGTGKTVLLSAIADYFKSSDDWIVVDASSKKNILETIAASIYEKAKVKWLFWKKAFSFSFQGLSISIQGENPVSSVNVLLEKMLDCLKKQNKKVLVTIDEADNSEEMKVFIRTFQSLIREKHAINLLMTGLYENISKLQGDKSLTFFVRAPKVFLKPLPLVTIASRYHGFLGVSDDLAIQMAKLTSGYAYAYQVMGYLFFSKHYSAITDAFLTDYDQYLSEYVYEMVYSSLSPNEQEFLKAFESDRPVAVSELVKKSGIDEKKISVYRMRLIKEGVIFSPSFGFLQISLPRFSNFLRLK